MLPPQGLRNLLTEAAHGVIREHELARLIQICRAISETYIRTYRSSLLSVLSFHGITQSDLAIDSVAEMFARNERGEYFHFGDFLSSFGNNLGNIDDVGLYNAFRAFTWKIANAQVSRSYAQHDPAGARISRNIRDAVRAS